MFVVHKCSVIGEGVKRPVTNASNGQQQTGLVSVIDIYLSIGAVLPRNVTR